MSSTRNHTEHQPRRAGGRAVAMALLVALLLSGCASPEPTDDMGDGTASTSSGTAANSSPPSSGPDTVTIRGHVFDEAVRPVAGATVRIVTLDQAAVTDADGAFDLGRHPRGIYPLHVTAPGFMPANHTALPDAAEDIRVVLVAGAPVEPYVQTWKFEGILQCAFEAFIISPSCDSAVVAAGADPLFGTNQSFTFSAEPGWKTVVVDVVFEPDAHPGLDGLRIAVRGTLDAEGSGEYQQYGRWNGPEPFTARLEPGGNYTDGVEPVPADASGFQVDVYPHSHGYHPGGVGLLGAGAAVDVDFQVYVNVFYVEPAPEGFTFRTQ